MLYLRFFREQMANGTKVKLIKRSQLRLTPLFQKLLIKLSDLFFDFGPKFKCYTQMVERINWISIFWKRNHYKNTLEACQTLKILNVVFISHIISFQFLPISRHFQITLENQNQSIRCRRVSCNWRIFSRLSQKQRFLEPIEKKYYVVNYWWTCVCNYVSIAPFW